MASFQMRLVLINAIYVGYYINLQGRIKFPEFIFKPIAH